MLSTFDHYRNDIRPDLFKESGGLINEQGEKWAKVRTMVNPIMMKPANANSYIPVIDQIAIDFVSHIEKIRDKNKETPANFGNDLRKWALESVCYIALDHRLNVFNTNQIDERVIGLIKASDDFIELSFDLEVKPSPWRWIATPKYKQLMQSFELMTNTTMHYIENAMAKLEKGERNENREPSVLEKMLETDKKLAVVMAIDMIIAGIDTVGSFIDSKYCESFLVRLKRVLVIQLIFSNLQYFLIYSNFFTQTIDLFHLQTTSTLVNCLFQLAKNPEKQKRLREELTTLPVDANGLLTPHSLQSIPYLSACVKETMRLSPVVPGNARQTPKNIVVKDYQIPEGVR